MFLYILSLKGEFYDLENNLHVRQGVGIKKWAESARIVDPDVDLKFDKEMEIYEKKNAQSPFTIFF